jgi:hypothetical protein
MPLNILEVERLHFMRKTVERLNFYEENFPYSSKGKQELSVDNIACREV